MQQLELSSQKKKCARAHWWEKLDVVLDTTPEGVKTCKVQCILCSTKLSTPNLSRLAASHFTETGCVATVPKNKPLKLESACSSQTPKASGAQSNSVTAQEVAMKQYIMPSAMETQALENLKMFFYTNPLPLYLIDDGFLRKAFAAFEITLTGRTQLSTTMLDNTYKEVKQQVMSKIPAGGLIALSTDGWKKKAAEQGVPLINVNILLPGGGSIFHKVVTAGGVVKNAQWIFDQHVALAEEVTGGEPELPIGVLMNNIKANRKAEGMLEEHDPHWLAIGCQAHGLSLLIKDLADTKKTTATAKVLSTAKMMSNVVGDSESIRSLVQRHQEFQGYCQPLPNTFWHTDHHLVGCACLQGCHQGSCVQ
jgi:hypothetical protein